MQISYQEVLRLNGLHQCGLSFSQLCERYAPHLTRGQLFNYFKRLNLPIRKKRVQQAVEYKGLRYTQDPDGRLRCTTQDRHFLNRRIYEEHYGSIGDHLIINKDKNPLNYNIDNLLKLTKSEVGKLFHSGENQFSKRNANPTTYIQGKRRRKNCNSYRNRVMSKSTKENL